MKKFLALVLALVMTMSLVTIAGAEDFTDNSSITYEEAVDVMTAAGVVGGYADGSFNPTAGLTRGAAAKIICNMILGPTTAEALTANDAPFSDVAVDNVFAGYIAYCVNEGIISGYADGTFKPAAPLTGYAFMKMLLGAIGYDAEVEGYTGSNWSIQVAKRALNIGLDKGLKGDFVGAKALTREEAALYAFNAMKATVVDYGNKTAITVGDIEITTSANATEQGQGGVYADKLNMNMLQFAEKYFSKLGRTDTTDTYGRPANKWVYGNETVGTYVKLDPVVTYSADWKYGEVADDVDALGYDMDAAIDVYDNNNLKSWTIAAADVVAAVDANTKMNLNGMTTELYDTNDDDKIDRIVVIADYLAEVTRVTADKATTKSVDERALTLKYTDAAGNQVTVVADEDTIGFDAVYAAVEEDDFVVVMPKGDNASSTYALEVYLPEVVTGAISYVKDNAKVTMDGVTYTASHPYDAVGTNFGLTSDVATLYLGNAGFVVGYEGPTTAGDKAVAVVKVYQSLEDGVIVDMIKGVTSDGNTVEWKYNDTGANSGVTPAANEIYTYADANDDGVKELASFSDVVTDDDKLVSVTVPAVTGLSTSTLTVLTGTGDAKAYYADDVKFVFFADGKATVKDGAQKVLAGSTAYATIDEAADGTMFVTAVFVKAAASASSTTTEDIVYVAAADGSVQVKVDGKDKTFTAYKAYINGEAVENFYAASTTVDRFYSVEVDDESGAHLTAANGYSAASGDLTVAIAGTVSAVVGDVATIDGVEYNLSKAVIADVTTNTNDVTTTSVLKDAVAEGTVTVSFLYDSDTNAVSLVYVTGYTQWIA